MSHSAAGPCCHALCDAVVATLEPSAVISTAGTATLPTRSSRSSAKSATPTSAAIAAAAFLAMAVASARAVRGWRSHPGFTASRTRSWGRTSGTASRPGATG